MPEQLSIELGVLEKLLLHKHSVTTTIPNAHALNPKLAIFKECMNPFQEGHYLPHGFDPRGEYACYSRALSTSKAKGFPVNSISSTRTRMSMSQVGNYGFLMCDGWSVIVLDLELGRRYPTPPRPTPPHPPIPPHPTTTPPSNHTTHILHTHHTHHTTTHMTRTNTHSTYPTQERPWGRGGARRGVCACVMCVVCVCVCDACGVVCYGI